MGWIGYAEVIWSEEHIPDEEEEVRFLLDSILELRGDDALA